MIRAVISVLLLVACAQAFLSEDEVVSPQTSHVGYSKVRMAGGETVSSKSNSFTFELLIKPKRSTITLDRLQPPACSGVLIGSSASAASKWALTSARCALSGDYLEIYGGTVKLNDASAVNQTVNVSAVTVNDEYLTDLDEYGDIALIPLNGSVFEADENDITLAVLPTTSLTSNKFLTKSVKMAGWGYPNDNYGANSPTLREVSSWVVPNWYCQLRHLGKTIKSSHICTAGLINKGPCTGDSGAPLILSSGDNDGTLIGLVTYVPNDGCDKGKPGVFTRITSYLDWIVSITGIDPDDQE